MKVRPFFLYGLDAKMEGLEMKPRWKRLGGRLGLPGIYTLPVPPLKRIFNSGGV